MVGSCAHAQLEPLIFPEDPHTQELSEVGDSVVLVGYPPPHPGSESSPAKDGEAQLSISRLESCGGPGEPTYGIQLGVFQLHRRGWPDTVMTEMQV